MTQTTTKYEIRPGAYYDSVVLMQLQKGLAGLPGVLDAGVVMATPANREVLAAAGFDLSGIDAAADDLLIAVKGEDEAAAAAALGQVDGLLQERKTGGGTAAYRPKSLAAAAKALPDANWVLISVPGRYAAGVADEALDLGKHVFLYSDNVPLDDEIRLKQKAAGKGLLVMGPDCGTAIVNGVGLGFANRVNRGNIGLVAASGTGLQAVTVGIHNRYGGVSQALGTGGRDLKNEVGGITALQAITLLAHDPETDLIVLISKPPDMSVAATLLQAAQGIEKRVVVCFIGYPPPAHQMADLLFAGSLDEAAELAVNLAETPLPHRGYRPPLRGFIRGLFSGGTLAYEMVLALQSTVSPLTSNVPLRPEQRMADAWQAEGHTILDLGEDEFTQGRLHPMMDNDLRLRRLGQEAADPEVGLLLLDVVLGEGAHPDPAAELAPAIAAAKEKRPELTVGCIVIGTDRDPQDTSSQISRLTEAGARVFRSVDEAAGYISEQIAYGNGTPDLPVRPLGQGFTAINVGLESFYDSLVAQGATAVQVDWRPPAGGNEKMMALLAKLKANS